MIQAKIYFDKRELGIVLQATRMLIKVKEGNLNTGNLTLEELKDLEAKLTEFWKEMSKGGAR